MELKLKYVFVLEFSIIIFLYIVRNLYTMVTGFVLPDEATYYYKIFQYLRYDGSFVINYSSRFLYQSMMLILSVVFNIDNMIKYVFISTTISAISAIGIIYVLWKILKESKLEQKYTLLSLFFLPPFIMVIPFGLTETISMLSAICGIYFIRKSEKTKYGIISAILIVSALYFRETYTFWIFFIGNLVYMIFRINNRKSIVMYLLVGITYFLAFDWIFTNFFIRLNSRFILSGSLSYVSIYEMIGLTVKNFSIGYILSYGFLGIIIIYAIVYYLKNYLGKNNLYDLIFLEGILGMTITVICIFWQSRTTFYEIIRVDTIRQFNISMFIVPIISIVYTQKPEFGKKVFSIIMLSYIILGLTLFTLPSSINISDISFSYRAPWIKVSDYLKNDTSKILIVGEPIMRLDMYLYMNYPNVNVTLPIIKYEFSNAINHYNKVFIYGEYHYNHIPAILENYPWHLDLVKNQTEYKVKMIWNDTESYFLEVMK